MLTMMQKRADFAGWLEDLLKVHEPRFWIETMERKELQETADRKTRISVMGSPCFFAAMYDRGSAASLADGIDAAGNVCDYEAHTFDVRIFWQNSYSSTYAGSSQKLFEECIYNAADATKPGVLATIRQGRQRTVAGDTYMVGRYQADAFDNLQRAVWDLGDIGAPDLCHYIQFNVTLF
jgi:hypothetical protein